MSNEKVPKEKLRSVYGEILRCGSSIDIDGFGEIRVKHLTVFDTDLVDEVRQKNYDRAVSRGLPTEKEKLEELKKEKLYVVLLIIFLQRLFKRKIIKIK